VAICFAPPQYVAADADATAVEVARQSLEQTLRGLMPRARELVGR
jgi:hypothetical protein